MIIHWIAKKAEALKELIIIFFFSLSPFLWLRGEEILIGHDSGVRLNFLDNILSYLYTWDPIANFGHNWALYTGFLVTQFPETFFAWLFGSVVYGEPFGFWFWFFAIGLSFYIFVKYFFSEEKFLPLRIIGPILFMYNFYILNGWSIFERAKFSLYIALPLMIVIFFKTAQKEWSLLRGSILFGVLFFFCNGGGSPPLYGGILVTFVLLAVYFIFSAPRIYTARVLEFVVLSGACVVLFNAYWILPQANLLLGNYEGAVSARGGIEGLISWERVISANTGLFNILRFQGFPDWYNNSGHPYANVFLINKLLIFLSFIPMIVIGLGLVLVRLRTAASKPKKILIFLLLLGTVGLFFTMGSHPPFGAVYTFFMRHVPGFAIFRSSLYKFAPTVYLAVIVFFGYYLSLFLDRFRLSKVFLFMFVVVIAAGTALYHFPYFSGNFFLIKDGFSTRLTIPDYVYNMQKALLAETTKQDRILLIPPLDVGFIITPIDTYSWGFYSLDALPRIMIHRSFLANDSNDNSVTKLLYEAVALGDDQIFLQLAARAGVTHILWRGDIQLSPGIQKSMPLSFWQEKVMSLKSLNMRHESGPWRLYEIHGATVNPMVYGTTLVSLINDTAVDDAYVVGKALSEDSTLVRVSSDFLGLPELAKERYIEAECFLCKNHEYTKLVEAITLPPLSVSRIPFLKDRQQRQAQKAVTVRLGKPQEIDARLGSAGLALSGKNIESYEEHMGRVVEALSTLTGRERDYYANRVLAYVDAHIRDTQEEARTIVENYRKKIAQYAWKAEGSTYRFGFTTPDEGEYSVWLHAPDGYAQTGVLDGNLYLLGTEVKLTAGYHRLLLTAKNIEGSTDSIVTPVFLHKTFLMKDASIAPTISFSQKNPTRYDVTVTDASSPYVLVLNQRFDPGWGLSIDGEREDYNHTQANGFANAWIVPKTGTYSLSLYYAPQQQLYLGLFISGSSIIGALIFLALRTRKKRTS